MPLEAKIEDLRFHDLRAGGSTGMIMAGLPAEIVRKVDRTRTSLAS